jgi:CRISPR-associated protein Csh2
MELIKNRSELVFLYDVKYCNPNGDPLDSNRPRIDEETGRCLVTDVRLKRTIRDYLFDKGYDGNKGSLGDIFIRDENGKAVTGTQRSKSYDNFDDFKSKFIDVRLFGAVSAPKKDDSKKSKKDDSDEDEVEEKLDTNKTFHLTGPVQFGMGKSLNVVKENFIKGTGAFTTSETAVQKTFREEYNITYGLIGFHGVINENAAKSSGLSLTDVDELIDGIWNGTKNLLTRSKKGHMPRLLIKIDYKVSGYFIGDLLERIALIPVDGKKEDSYDDIVDFTLDVSKLNEVLKKNVHKIEKVTVEIDDRVILSEPILSL